MYWEQKCTLIPNAIHSFLYKCTQNSCLNYLKHQAIVSGYEDEVRLVDNPEHMHLVQKEKESQIGSKRFDLNSHSGRYAPIFREK